MPDGCRTQLPSPVEGAPFTPLRERVTTHCHWAASTQSLWKVNIRSTDLEAESPRNPSLSGVGIQCRVTAGPGGDEAAPQGCGPWPPGPGAGPVEGTRRAVTSRPTWPRITAGRRRSAGGRPRTRDPTPSAAVGPGPGGAQYDRVTDLSSL
jgi:hypothetical protein